MAAETGPRRAPRRRSSEQIVASILDATEELLEETPIDALTTNRVARRAGVSIGSLYQYFPNKQAVVAGVVRRVNERIERLLYAALQGPGSPHERAEAAIRAFCSVEIGSIALRARLVREVPRSWSHTDLQQAERNLLTRFAELSDSMFPNLAATPKKRRVLTVFFAVRGAVRGALLYEPEALKDESFVRDLARMVLSDA